MNRDRIISIASAVLITLIAILAFVGIYSLGNGVQVIDYEVKDVKIDDGDIYFGLDLTLYSDLSFDVNDIEMDVCLRDYVYDSKMPIVHSSESSIKSKSQSEIHLDCTASAATAYLILKDMISAKGSIVTIHIDLSGRYMLNMLSFDAGIDMFIRLAEDGTVIAFEKQWHGDEALDICIHNMNRSIQFSDTNVIIYGGGFALSIHAIQKGTEFLTSLESDGPLTLVTEKLIDSEHKTIRVNGKETEFSQESLNAVLTAIRYILETCS